MTIKYFLKKIYEEYNSKKLDDTDYLSRCLKNYNDKGFNIEFLFFCSCNNVLLEMLYNVNTTYTYITNFNSLIIPSQSELPYFNFKNADLQLQINEKRLYWNELDTKYNRNYVNCANLIDHYIIEMLLCDLQFKQDIIIGKDYQKIINDLEKLIDDTFAQKEVIYFLLLKDLLLEFYLNLLICLNHKIGDFTEISSIYQHINSIDIKYPKYEKNLIVFWFNVNHEFSEFKANQFKYYFDTYITNH